MPKLFRFVAWLQIIVGGAVVAYGALLLLSSGAAFVGSLLCTLGALGVVAGAILLKASTLGWRGSVLLQLIQIPAFSLGTVLYRLGLGALLTLGVQLPQSAEKANTFSLLVNFGLGADFAISFGQAVEQRYVGVNVVALTLLIALVCSRPHVEQRAPGA